MDKHALVNLFPPEARRAVATAEYTPAEFPDGDRIYPQNHDEACAWGALLMKDGLTALSAMPEAGSVAEYLAKQGRIAQDDVVDVGVLVTDFMERFDRGEMTQADLLEYFEVDCQ